MDQPTDFDELLANIREQLRHPHIRERRAAIETLFSHMQAGDCLLEGIAILKEVERQDGFLIIQDLAKEKLAAFKQLVDLDLKLGEERHIFAAQCPKGHMNYYDKRKVCGGRVQFLGPSRDELYLECKEQNCHTEFVVRVDCEGYK